MEEVASRLGFRSVAELVRAWWARPDVYTPLIIEEKEKLHKKELKQ